MSKHRKDKHRWVIDHRQTMYLQAFQKYLDGKVPYSYVQKRLDKLKEVIKVKI